MNRLSATTAIDADTGKIEAHLVDALTGIAVLNIDQLAIFIYSEGARLRLIAALESVTLMPEGEARAMAGDR